jgi:hypothetical protein
MKYFASAVIGIAIGISCALGSNAIYQHTHKLHIEPSIKATCRGTTLLWNNYDPDTGTGGNNMEENAPACGGKR